MQYAVCSHETLVKKKLLVIQLMQTSGVETTMVKFHSDCYELILALVCPMNYELRYYVVPNIVVLYQGCYPL